jgi:hypothetical protein
VTFRLGTGKPRTFFYSVGTNDGGPSWLVCWTRRASTIDFCPALAALVSQLQNIIFFRTLFHFIISHLPATWADSRAGSPVFVSQLFCVFWTPIEGRTQRGLNSKIGSHCFHSNSLRLNRCIIASHTHECDDEAWMRSSVEWMRSSRVDEILCTRR